MNEKVVSIIIYLIFSVVMCYIASGENNTYITSAMIGAMWGYKTNTFIKELRS